MHGDGQRAAIIEALRDAELDTNDLARAVGLHPNTVRWHLGVLADEGLVEASPKRRPSRGRPSVIYRLTPDGVAHDRDEYRLLATMLAGVVASDEHGVARAYEEGVRWGRRIQAAEPERSVPELLDRQGFAAAGADDRIEMRRCPFYALAECAPGVVCTLHQGIIDGALAESGSARHVEQLDPFVEPALCVARLSPAA